MIDSDAIKRENLFKQRKHKQFNYRPRFQREERVPEEEDFEAKWQDARMTSQKRGKRFISLPVLIIMLVVIIMLMYVLDGYIN